MNLNGFRRSDNKERTIKLTVPAKLAERVRVLHKISTLGEGPYGCHVTSIETWLLQIIDNFVVENRSGKFRDDPTRYHDRNGEDAEHAIL
ncbi:MAG: hypothetical protein OEY86_07540 [Nitrospira sp.]|nr:hypothetical protein [Nitrospira sp.]